MNLNVLQHFYAQLKDGKTLCLMPVSRLRLREPVVFGDVVLLPDQWVEPSSLRIVSWPEFELNRLANNENVELAWGQSAGTAITRDEFFSSALAALTVDLSWDQFFDGTHSDHKAIISECANRVEDIFDLIRLELCDLHRADTLPGRVAVVSDTPFSAALFYNIIDHESYIIAGQLATSLISAGVGLEIDPGLKLLDINLGETGQRARSILRHFTFALEASSETQKAFQVFAMLEALSSGNYESGEEYRKNISTIISNNYKQYDENKKTLERWTTSQNHQGSDIRTMIVHRGMTFEESLPSDERKSFWLKMHQILAKSISTLATKSDMSWSEFETWRKERRIRLAKGEAVEILKF